MTQRAGWWGTAIVIGIGLTMPMGAAAQDEGVMEEEPQEVSLMPQPVEPPQPVAELPPPEIISTAPIRPPLTREQHWNGSLRKLGRGVANLFTCPLELVREPYLTERKDGYIAAWTVGVARGVGSTIVRALAGLAETMTFVFPNGDTGFEPLVKPEFVYRSTDWAE